MLSSLSSFLSAHAEGLVQNVLRPVPTLITAARTAHPWPLHLGNSLWAIVAFRQLRDSLPSDKRPSVLASMVCTFVMYAMSGSFVVNLLLGRPPSVLLSDTIIPVFVLNWIAVHACPGDALFRVLSSPTPNLIIDTLAGIDGYTTALNYMEEAYPVAQGRLIFPIVCGLSVMLGGGTLRHFAAHGWTAGLAKYDEQFRSGALFMSVLFAAYYYGALLPCKGEVACASRTGWYEALTLLGIARGLFLESLAAFSPAPPPSKAKAD